MNMEPKTGPFQGQSFVASQDQHCKAIHKERRKSCQNEAGFHDDHLNKCLLSSPDPWLHQAVIVWEHGHIIYISRAQTDQCRLGCAGHQKLRNMCRPGPGAEQGALVTRNIITGTILGQGTLPPGCHATLMPVTCHYCPCHRCHHLMSCVFYLITGESGSELGAGLVVSPCPVQLTAHPGAPSLSSLFLQSLDQSKTNPCCGNNLD